MICVKCGGQSVFPAMNEAPDGVRDWRKCMSCGKCWDPNADVLDTVKRAFEEWQPDEATEEAGGDDGFDAEDRRIAHDHADAFDDLDPLEEPVVSPLDLAMKDVRVRREPKKKEKAVMPKFVSEEHRERWIAGQKLSRKLKREAAGGQETTAKKKPGRPRKSPAAVVSVPAMREPETLPTPRPLVTAGSALMSVLDNAIQRATCELDTLERAKAILMRQVIQ